MSLRLSLKFANWDNATGQTGELTVPANMPVLELKKLILERWPPGYPDAAPSDPASLRVFAMGAMLQDGRTLAESRVPSFDYPTPIHVSVRPGGRPAAPAQAKGAWAGAPRVRRPRAANHRTIPERRGLPAVRFTGSPFAHPAPLPCICLPHPTAPTTPKAAPAVIVEPAAPASCCVIG
jgi:hypothetical protein